MRPLLWLPLLLALTAGGSVVALRAYVRARGGAGSVVRLVPGAALQWAMPIRPPLEEFPESEEPTLRTPEPRHAGPYPVLTLPGYRQIGELRESGFMVKQPPEGAPATHWEPVLVRYPGGWSANPTTNALVGLADWSAWLQSSDEVSRYHARHTADWLLETQQPDGSWRHASDWQEMRSGWSSAMTQGLAISLLARLFAETGSERYLHAAQQSKRHMLTEVSRGGTLGRHASGARVLEEYPGARYTQHVLNGALYALLGLWDLAQTTGGGDLEWRTLADEQAGLLAYYDTGGWSRYALPENGLRRPVGPFYHTLHLAQLSVMAMIHDSEQWSTWRETWSSDLSEWRQGARTPLNGTRALEKEPRDQRPNAAGRRR